MTLFRNLSTLSLLLTLYLRDKIPSDQKMWFPLPRVTYTWRVFGQWALGWDLSPLLSLLLEHVWVWKTLDFSFCTYPYCPYFYRGTCICKTVTAPVTFTNKWINILHSFSKIRKWLTRIIWRAWPLGPTVTRRPPSWQLCRRTALTGRYVHYFTPKVVGNMYNCANFMYSCP
jgi:hypothetical protein